MTSTSNDDTVTTNVAAASGSAASTSAASSSAEHIRVCFRVRPFDRRELSTADLPGWVIDTSSHTLTRRSNTVKSLKHPPQMVFPCKTLFDSNATTEEVYEKQVKEIVASSMCGINGTVFAYGQTASGKTFTMKGRGPETPGIIPLAMRQVFKYIAQCEDHEFLLRVSYIEIYNERVKDLLSDTPTPDLPIHESKQRGVYVNSKDVIVSSEEEVLRIMEQGEARRHYGHTEMNDLSSRSHTILRLIIESSVTQKDQPVVAEEDAATATLSSPRKAAKRTKPKVKVSTLNFVDLAGSERLAQTNVAIGSETQKEGSYINKSLMFLGVIISRLSEGDQCALPFRESKLTRILQPSIGGNARTSIIVTVSPSASNVEHTVSSLRFGSRAITIKNHARVNEIRADQAFMTKHQEQIQALEKRLTMMHERVEDDDAQKENEWKEAQAATEQMQLREDLEAKLATLQKLILRSTSGQAQDFLQGQRRRHTFGAAHLREMSSSSIGSSAPGSKKNSLGGGAGGNDATFREQQLVAQRARITQLESLLSELSAENQELLNKENRYMAEEEETVKQAQLMSGKLNLWMTGAGVEKLPVHELVSMEAQMQATLKIVQKQMYFAQFMATHPPPPAPVTPIVQPTPAAEGTLDGTTSDEQQPVPVDPKMIALQVQMEEMKKELEESRLASTRLSNDLNSYRVETSELIQSQESQLEKAISERTAAARLVEELQESLAQQSRELALAKEQTYKYSKQLLAQTPPNGFIPTATTNNTTITSSIITPPITPTESTPLISTIAPSIIPSTVIPSTTTAAVTPIAASILSDRTNVVVNKSATGPVIGTSLVDMLHMKSSSGTFSKLSTATTPLPLNGSNSLLANLINRTK